MSGEEIDHECTDEIVCPHCGYTYADSWEMHESEETECAECEKPFRMSCSTNVTYTTTKIANEGNDDE